jgi:hypothetical protein
MPSTFVVVIIGILLAYIGYLQLQLYINRRITNAFQDVAVVVPPAKSKPEPSSAMLNLILFLMCIAVFYMMIR